MTRPFAPPALRLVPPPAEDPLARLAEALGWEPTPAAIALVAGWDYAGTVRLLEALREAEETA